MKSLSLLSLFEEFWSQHVKSSWHPPKGLFASGDVDRIAKQAHKDSRSYKQAVSRINFYYNRAGKNIPDGRTKAKAILKKIKSLYGR